MRMILILSLLLLLTGVQPGTATESLPTDALERGKEISFDRNKGNCAACHVMEGAELAGNYGPPLVMMKARFPDRAVLRAQIWDASTKNSDTRMPPFGRHRILTEEEIDLVVDFIHSL